MRLPTKPWQMPTTTGTLPIRRADRDRGRQSSGAVVRAAHDLEQPHDVGGAEEVHAATRSPGRPVAWRDRVDVEVGRVGGEDGARLGDPVELPKTCFFSVHVLEHRLDHQVGVGSAFEADRSA